MTNAPFDGAVSLAQAIGTDPRFLDCMTRKMMTYALGRSLVDDDKNGIPTSRPASDRPTARCRTWWS